MEICNEPFSMVIYRMDLHLVITSNYHKITFLAWFSWCKRQKKEGEQERMSK